MKYQSYCFDFNITCLEVTIYCIINNHYLFEGYNNILINIEDYLFISGVLDHFLLIHCMYAN